MPLVGIAFLLLLPILSSVEEATSGFFSDALTIVVFGLFLTGWLLVRFGLSFRGPALRQAALGVGIMLLWFFSTELVMYLSGLVVAALRTLTRG